MAAASCWQTVANGACLIVPLTLCTPQLLSVSEILQEDNRSLFSSPLRLLRAVLELQTTTLNWQDGAKEIDWYVDLEIARNAYVSLVANHFYSRTSSGMAF